MLYRTLLERHYGVIAFTFAGIMIVPQLFYIANVQDFNADAVLPILPLLVGIPLLMLGILARISDRGQRFLIGLGLSIIICDQFLGAQIAQLDGSSSDISTSNFTTVANTLVFLGLPLALAFKGSKFKPILMDLTLILTLLATGLTIYSLILSFSSAKPDQASEPTELNESIKLPSNNPNIYLIWLDAMETRPMLRYISSDSNKTDFSGFTLFRNNSSNYLYTAQSYISFMSGTVYNGGDYDQWRSKSDGLRQIVKSQGYNISSYAKKAFISDIDDKTSDANDIFLSWTKVKHPFIGDFITYWIVRSLPSALSNISLPHAKGIGSKASYILNHASDYSQVSTISDGIEPLTGVFTLKQLIIDEESRSDTGEFVVAQAVIPHGPNVIDEDCNYRGNRYLKASDTYYQQVVCSSKLVTRYLQKLKALDRFDSSLIVIMSDHGAGWGVGGVDEQPLNESFTSWSPSMVVSRASSLLMIKPPKVTEEKEFNISNRETQLIDLLPTVLTLAGFENQVPLNIEGRNVFSTESHKRKKEITYFKPGGTIDPFEAKLHELVYQADDGITQVSSASDFKSTRDLKPLNCGQTIDLSSADYSSSAYTSTGLSATESWGRWSSGDLVRFTFRTKTTGCQIRSLSLRLKAFTTQFNPTQSAKIILNGKQISSLSIKLGDPSPTELELQIPSSGHPNDGINTLEFHIDKPTSPKEAGVGNDKRKLGLGFVSLTFN